MHNHDQKIRDMARSVLPSSRRKSAREDIATAKRKNRRKVRRNLHLWAQYDDPYEFTGFADHDYIYGYGEDQNIKMAVQARRDGDKLSVVHWAERLCATKLAHLDETERYFWFKKALGDNLPGRHALGHVADKVAPVYRYVRQGGFMLDWLIEDEDGTLREATDAERQARRDRLRERETRQDVAKCYLILETHGAQGRLNDAMKNAWRRAHALCQHTPCFYCQRNGWVGPRLLLGPGDVETFVTDVTNGWAGYSPQLAFKNFVVNPGGV